VFAFSEKERGERVEREGGREGGREEGTYQSYRPPAPCLVGHEATNEGGHAGKDREGGREGQDVPVIQTTSPVSCNARTRSCLCWGDMRAKMLPFAMTSSRALHPSSWFSLRKGREGGEKNKGQSLIHPHPFPLSLPPFLPPSLLTSPRAPCAAPQKPGP